jgi:hypothetical protein
VEDVGDGRLLHPLFDDLHCPVIQYADAALIILRVDPSQLRRLRGDLDSISRATGLGINFHKSTFVPIHVSTSRAADLATILGCPVLSSP